MCYDFIVNEIKKGSIVRFKDGYYRVTAKFKRSVNLGSVFGSKPLHKGVDLSEVVEAEAKWYAEWQQSESYQCM